MAATAPIIHAAVVEVEIPRDCLKHVRAELSSGAPGGGLGPPSAGSAAIVIVPHLMRSPAFPARNGTDI